MEVYCYGVRRCFTAFLINVQCPCISNFLEKKRSFDEGADNTGIRIRLSFNYPCCSFFLNCLGSDVQTAEVTTLLEFLSSGRRMNGMVSTLDTQQLEVLSNGQLFLFV